jgi:hypothetical protein
MAYTYDAFICHASEDKDTFVRKLAEELKLKDLGIWYDEFTLTVGDSLLNRINEGLLQSKYGIVIFSKAFFTKNWPKRELEGLVALEEEGQKKILPVWLDVQRDDILKTYPILANLYAADASRGMQYVIDELMKVFKPTTPIKQVESENFKSENPIISFSKTYLDLSLSDEARELIKEASLDKQGTILCIRNHSGTSIVTNGRNLIIEQTPREIAKWEGALDELIESNLVKDRGNEKKIFALTKLGYKVADAI